LYNTLYRERQRRKRELEEHKMKWWEKKLYSRKRRTM
jgi:hypothetical protein